MDRLKHLTIPLLLFAVLLVLVPMVELAGAVWPLGVGNAEWRFGAFGLLSNSLLQPVLGSFVVVVVATLRDLRWLQRTMWVLNALAASFLLVALPLFMLDALELRSQVPDAARTTFDIAAARAVLLHGFTLIVLSALSRGGYKSWRGVPSRTRDKRREPLPLVTPGQ